MEEWGRGREAARGAGGEWGRGVRKGEAETSLEPLSGSLFE